MRKTMMALLMGAFLLASPALANGLKDDVALDALAEKVTITPAQAVKAAKARVQGRVKEICLKAYSGKPVYEVEFDNDREVLVDARTGRVMERPSGTK
jgi:Predicted membrane protein